MKDELGVLPCQHAFHQRQVSPHTKQMEFMCQMCVSVCACVSVCVCVCLCVYIYACIYVSLNCCLPLQLPGEVAGGALCVSHV